MPGYNRVIEVGNLTRDPKLKWVDVRGETKAVVNLGLAVNSRIGRKEEVLYIDGSSYTLWPILHFGRDFEQKSQQAEIFLHFINTPLIHPKAIGFLEIEIQVKK